MSKASQQENMYMKMPDKLIASVEEHVKLLLHASRDCMRNQNKYDATKVPFSANDGYYGEAFGIFRGLALAGYGSITGACNTPTELSNFRWWFSELENTVLQEENFGGTNECDFCYERWGKDCVRKS